MKKPFTFRVQIRGAWWKVIRKAPPREPDALGLCDYGQKIIFIRPGAELPATIIHEAIHAAVPDLDESAVEAAEEAVMVCLKKWGLLIKDQESK